MLNNELTVRVACRERMPLGGADAQALEHALSQVEAERDNYKNCLIVAVELLSEIKRYCSPFMGGRIWVELDEVVAKAKSKLGI